MLWKSPLGEGPLTLGKLLGRGGEGSVFAVESTSEGNPQELVAKVYHDPSGRAPKLVEMLRRPVVNDHVAWPKALLIENGLCKGYLMKRLSYETHRPWSEVAHASTRRESANAFDYRYALYALVNLSYLLDSVHKAGHFVGDLNESNVLVGADATVSLVDTDSAQVGDFLCLVGKPEFTAPEIVGSFRENKRTRESDLYALGVMGWQILTGGAHPTDGQWLGAGDPPNVTERIRRGAYPAIQSFPSFESLSRVPTEAVSQQLRQAFLRLLSVDPQNRGTTDDFRNALERELSSLTKCSLIETHWYSGTSCVWCERAASGLNDPWGPEVEASPSQLSLPPIGFQEPKESTPQRVKLQTGGNVSSPSNAGFANSANTPQSSYFSQGGSSQTPAYFSQAPTQPPPEIPTKIKGKSVLVFGDGSWDVRPPLLDLARSNFKLALSCFFDEIPTWMRFWWGQHSRVPKVWALAVGLLLSIALSASWLTLGLIDSTFLPDWAYSLNLLKWLGIISAGTSGFFSLFFFGSGMLFWAKHKREPAEAPWKTLGRACLVSVVYGPFFVLAALFFVGYLLVLFLVSLFKA